MPLTAEGRAEGARKLKERLESDPAARVRQRLKAGRPAKIVNRDNVTVLEAVMRLADEADKASGLMEREGLDPMDIRLALAHVQPGTGDIGFKWLPESGKIGAFITALERMEAKSHVLYLGIIWGQRDRKTGESNLWVTQWLAGDAAVSQLKMLRDLVAQAQN